MEDKFILGGKEFQSRFILGSGKYNLNLIKAAVQRSLPLHCGVPIQRRVRTSWILFRKGLHCFRTHPEREMQKRLCGLQD